MAARESVTSQRRLDRAERIKEVWKLRLAGWRMQQMAEYFGVTDTTISEDVAEAYKVYRQEYESEALHVAKLHIARLDEMLSSLWPVAKTGDRKTVETCLKVLDQRAKITGHYRPEKVEITEKMSEEELAAWAKEHGHD